MKRLLPKLSTVLAFAGLWAGTNAYATLELNSPGVVGISIGVTGSGQGNLAFEQGIAQHLLDMTANTIEPGDASSPTTAQYATSATEYSGTLTLTGAVHGDNAYHVGEGFQYAIAKYDGQNAGYVLFYLGGQATDLPQYSYNLWYSEGNHPQLSYEISGFSAFKTTGDDPPVVPEPTTVLAGLLMLLPLGASAFRIIRKKS